MTDTNTLAPCPFCGARAETDFIPEYHSYQIECSDFFGCTARVTRDSELGAIEAWNLRTVDAEPLWRTDAEIVEQTEILARYLLSWKWGLHPESPDAQLRNSQNTKAQKAWNAACEIQDLLTATDVENAVAEVEDDK